MKIKNKEMDEESPASAPDLSRRNSFSRDVAVVLAVAWAARLIFILVVPPTARSFDTYSWEAVAQALAAGQNPYHTTAFLNWPPLWMEIIFLISKVATAFGIPFFRALQLFLILTESAVIVLLIKLIRDIAPTARVRALVIVGIALNPAAILLICQHGNFDVLVALWLMLFAGNLLRYNRTNNFAGWLCACLFLGLGILTKTVPLILCPLLAGGFRMATMRTKFLGAVLLFGPVALGMSIIYVLAPDDVVAKVLEYRSSPGCFGISGLLQMTGFSGAITFYNAFFYAALATILISITIIFWQRQSVGVAETILFAALFLAFIPALGPGYAPQYLYWFLPFLVVTFAAFKNKWRAVLISFGIIAGCTYLIEYALLPSHGMYFLRMLANESDQPPSWLSHIQKLPTGNGQTLLRLPLFIAYIVLLASGTMMLLHNIRNSLQKNQSL